jgi:hypothetical protein
VQLKKRFAVEMAANHSLQARRPELKRYQKAPTSGRFRVRQVDVLLPMIRPHDAEPMQAWPVSRELNRVGLSVEGA